jgi:hypothetical protein
LSNETIVHNKKNDHTFLVGPGGKDKDMAILFLITLAFVILAVAAYRWGADSSDGITSSEWESRQRWFGFH